MSDDARKQAAMSTAVEKAIREHTHRAYWFAMGFNARHAPAQDVDPDAFAKWCRARAVDFFEGRANTVMPPSKALTEYTEQETP